METRIIVDSRREEANCSDLRKIIREKLCFILLLLCAFFTNPTIAQNSISNSSTTTQAGFEYGETLFYRIYFKWGFIWKEAANGELFAERSVYEGKDVYKMSLSCKTLSFVDKIMPVRDTLNAITTLDVQPLLYSKITNEGSYRGKDFLKYRYDDGLFGGDVRIVRENREDALSTIWSEAQPYDMLSVFYYLRYIDFKNLDMYAIKDIPIITKDRLTMMRVKYMGQTIAKLHKGKEYPSYKIDISFLNDKNLDEQDHPIEVWMSNDDRKIPIRMVGKLPIGSLQAEWDDAK